MEIVSVENLREVLRGDVYYEFGGEFYAMCGACGSPVKIDHHRTKRDLLNDVVGEEEFFCDNSCRARWLRAMFPDAEAADVAGHGEEYRKLVAGK